MEDRLLTKRQTCEMVGYSKQHVARLVLAGVFPRPCKPFGRNGRALWSLLEIQAFIASLKLKR